MGTTHAAERPSGGAPLADFDDYVAAAMKQWKVPGLAIAIVKGDSTVLLKGYGVRTIGGTEPVDAETMFAIGSSSKAFTGAVLEMLADEGTLDFDKPVTDYLPWFEMYDPWVTREIRVRDLLLHRSGMSRGDSIWYATSNSREDIVRSIRRLKPTTSFRSHFQYQNLMFITAGEVAHSITGQNWDDLVKTRIFKPLGMVSSNTSTRDLLGNQNVASPHASFEDGIRVIPYRNIDNAGAAGSINSNATDMARWLRLWLNNGTFEGKRLVSEAKVKEATTAQFQVDDPDLIARLMSPRFLGYGFGWFVEDFRGQRWVNHGGNIDGMAAMVGFLPESKIGIVILTNLSNSDITMPLMANAFDRLLGISPPRDYNAEYYVANQAVLARYRADAKPVARVEGTKPSLPLEAYAGTYDESFMGSAVVRYADGKLTVQYSASPIVGTLEHYHFDSFVVAMNDAVMGNATEHGPMLATFHVGPAGKVDGMTLPFAPGEWTRRN
jgi:CubicO group peptidase (beta-lactamase class C family)